MLTVTRTFTMIRSVFSRSFFKRNSAAWAATCDYESSRLARFVNGISGSVERSKARDGNNHTIKYCSKPLAGSKSWSLQRKEASKGEGHGFEKQNRVVKNEPDCDMTKDYFYKSFLPAAQLYRTSERYAAAMRLRVTPRTVHCSYLYPGLMASPLSRNLHTVMNVDNRGRLNPRDDFLAPENFNENTWRRQKSFRAAFMKLFLKLFKEKDLQAKEKVLREIEAKAAQKEDRVVEIQQLDQAKKTHSKLSYLMYGCTSSRHLLDLMVPWIEENQVSLDDIVKAVEYLQNLVYSEVLKLHPNLPYGSVSIMYQNIKVLRAEEKIMKDIHDHQSFQAMCRYLKDNTDQLTNSQFSTCFSCLTHLGLSHFDSLMTKFYTRLMNSGAEDFSVLDIVNLFNVAKCHRNSVLIRETYIADKVNMCVKQLESKAIDNETFRALLVLAQSIQFGVKEAELVSLYSILYKVCVETNILNDLNCACELLLHLNDQFYNVKRSLMSLSKVNFHLNEIHRKNIIQDMSGMCLDKIIGSSYELSPLKMRNLFILSSYCVNKTKLKVVLQKRTTYLLNKRLEYLSLPEVIWLLCHRSLRIDLNTEQKATIASKFKELDLPCLYQAFDLGNFYVHTLGIEGLLSEKILEYKEDIIEHYMYSKALAFFWALWSHRKIKTRADQKTVDVTQQLLSRIHSGGFFPYETNFAVSLIMTLPKFSDLAPSILKILHEVSMRESTYNVLSLGKIFVILYTLFSSDVGSDQRGLKQAHDAKRNLYEKVRFHILYKTILRFQRSMQHEFFGRNVLQICIRNSNILLSFERMDSILHQIVHEKFSEVPIQYLSELMEICRSNLRNVEDTQKEVLLFNVVTFALQNKEYLAHRDWKDLVRFLLKNGYSAHGNAELQEVLQTVVNEFEPIEKNCSFVLQCASLGVDMSKALKIIFSAEFLNRIDEHVAGNFRLRRDFQLALFRLNQTVCLNYPSLKVPWFQDESDALTVYQKHVEAWRFLPRDLPYVVRCVAGGDRYVGKKVFLDYGIPAWRVLLLDEQNNPVTFTTRNLKMANEMKYSIFVIFFILKWYETAQLRIDQLVKAGYKPVVIYRSEWNSLGLPTIGDKIEFLQKRIYDSPEYLELHDPPVVNNRRISNQWRQFLEQQ